MKHILDCPEIEKEYLLFSLAPIQHYDRIVDLANLWTCGLEHEFAKQIQQPSQDYLERYAESEAEWFLLYFQADGADTSHPEYGRYFDMRRFEDMKQLRKILQETTV